jgi:hypothetical protein
MCVRANSLIGIATAIAVWAACAFPAAAQTAVHGTTPACDDPGMVRNVEFSYQAAENMPTDPGTLKIGNIRDVGLYPPPKLANQYATTTNYVKEARFCEGVVTLPNGSSEQAYWRIYYVVNTAARDLAQAEFCSPRHDMWQNQCEVYKPDAGAKPLN